jgi:formate hydrogenlyase subunit 4
MIHEVMVLDHSGPDFALIELGSFCKLFFYSTLISRLVLPFDFGVPGLSFAIFIAGLILVYGVTGITESVIARYRMDKVPQFVLTSFALAFFATIITLEFIK